MNDLEEVRYPWDNLAQFLSGGYPAETEALHLVLGWLFVLWLIVWVQRNRDFAVSFRFSTLYFALTVFTNPAYTMAGVSLNEMFGVLAISCLVLARRPPRLSDASPVCIGLFAVFFVSLLHMLVAQLIYPELTSEAGVWFTKFAINAKILVLAVNLLIVGHTLRRGVGVDLLVKSCIAAGTAGLCLYVLQLGVLLSGTPPYGTYLDAGFVGVPSFGSVSVERGHFGKFMAPYFPFFLFALLAWQWRWRFYLLTLVTLINFSASSQVFFAAFSMLALWKFRHRASGWTAFMGAVVLGGAMAALLVNYWEVFSAVGLKIYEIAIQGDESTGGGRSFGTFLDYARAYPLGLGYSGSTLRTAPGLPEINAAHFAFVTQYSFLAVPVLVGYFFLMWRTIKLTKAGPLFLDAMSIGVVMSMVIFAIDILWFVPLIWLPYEMIWRLHRKATTPPPQLPVTTPDRAESTG